MRKTDLEVKVDFDIPLDDEMFPSILTRYKAMMRERMRFEFNPLRIPNESYCGSHFQSLRNYLAEIVRALPEFILMDESSTEYSLVSNLKAKTVRGINLTFYPSAKETIACIVLDVRCKLFIGSLEVQTNAEISLNFMR